VIYIQEAHSSDLWQLPVNEKQNVVFAMPKSMDERASVAESCVRKLNIHIPALLDNFGNSTERAYTGWPDRLYVLDRSGKITYKSEPGPFGFNPAGMKAALVRATSD
jgi:type I thyroxine 5'-deiodinase